MKRPLFSRILIGLALCVGVFAFAAITGLIDPHLPAALVATGWHAATVHLHAVGSTLLATAPVAIVSKDPRALALRAEAEAREAELFDPKKRYEPAEAEKRAAEIADLRRRADMAAKFTAADEITRQGGDADLTRLAPGSEDADVQVPAKQAELLRKRAQKEFGSIGKMVLALGKHRQDITDAQRQVLTDLGNFTRTIVGTASDPSGGEFLLPLQQEPSIFRVSNAQMGILNYGRRYTVKGRTLRIPYLVQDSATGASGVVTLPLSGGIADISIVGEGGTKPTAQPSFNQRLLTAYKWAAYTEIGDEVLDDDFTGELDQSVLDIIGTQVLNSMDDKMTNSGSGTSEPLAALHSSNGARLSIASRASSGTISVADIFAMYARHTFGPNSYWSCSRYVIEALMKLTLAGTSLVSWLPSLREAPTPTLLGLPIRMNDFQPTLGTIGDLALINPDFYAVGIRTQLTMDVSTHYQFRNDVTAYRFVARAGGMPIPTGTFAYKATGTTKTDQHSPFVVIPT